ncbi:MAG: glycosyltransferase [Proteobacteria bacterium]|nr:MAG: glycosyltransferase [Pseudomonadota bacterium]
MSNDLPLVSIVVASYNNAKYLEECLESAANQTYINIEIIIADDCSTDNSREIIEKFIVKYPNKKIVPVLHEKNIGACANLNIAILNYATGDFVKVIDSDDYLSLDAVEVLSKELCQNPNRPAFVYAKSLVFVNDLNHKKSISHTSLEKEVLSFKGLYFRNYISACTVMFRRSVFVEVGGYDNGIYIGDYYLWLRMAAKYQFSFVDKVVGFYNASNDNSISKNYEKMLAANIQIRLLIYQQNKAYISVQDLYRSILVSFGGFFVNTFYQTCTFSKLDAFKILIHNYREILTYNKKSFVNCCTRFFINDKLKKIIKKIIK